MFRLLVQYVLAWHEAFTNDIHAAVVSIDLLRKAPQMNDKLLVQAALISEHAG